MFVSFVGHPKLERRNPVLLLLCTSRSGYPPRILKRGGLESSGPILISSNGKTKSIPFFLLFFSSAKQKYSDFLKVIVLDFSRFLDFLTLFFSKFWRFLYGFI